MGRQKHNTQLVTIKDVAQLAGVSISTVSRVLNRMDRVSDDTRARVENAVEQLGFTKNALATSLVTGQTHIVIIVVPDFTLDFHHVILQSAAETLRCHGFQSMILSSGEDPEADPLAYLNRYIHLVDGALVIPTRKRIFDLQQFAKPVVLVNRTISGCPLNSVTIDNFQDCYNLTKLLLENNHKRVAILSQDTDLNIGTDCLQGFRQALLDGGIQPEERYIHPCQAHLTKHRPELCLRQAGYQRTLELLAMEEPPTAILTCNENISVGCLEALQEKHLVPGKNISIVAHDDLSIPLHSPGITATFTRRDLLGRYAAERLIELIQNPSDNRVIHRALTSELIQRDSVACL